MEKTKRGTLKTVILIIIIILFAAAVVLLGFLYSDSLDSYKQMCNFDAGYSDGEKIVIGEKTYSLSNSYDFKDYALKNDTPVKFYHIVASDFKPIAVLQDFVVGAYDDDPNGYIIREQRDAWGFSGNEYYSADFRFPDSQADEIRQLLITFSPLEKPSAGYTSGVSGKQDIENILTCVQNGKSPTEQIKEANIEMLSDSYKIWVDYPDFPMYQMIYDSAEATVL